MSSLPPTVFVVDDDEPISDLDVQISITHTHDDYLAVYLMAPDGERVELFTGVGGNDDHFDNTIFDDEAYQPTAFRESLLAMRTRLGLN